MNAQLYIVSFIALFIRQNLPAQNEYFENNPIWGISQPCQFAPLEPEWGKKTTFFIDGDTLLNDEVFVKIFQEGFTYYGFGTPNYTETTYSNPLPLALLRSEDLKIFKWNEELNVKELLYDFDVAVGQTFNVSQSIYPYPLEVASISYVTLDGMERKVITVMAEEPSWEHIYVEGVGHWRGLWYENQPQLDCQSYLTCFSLNGESYAVNTDEIPWLIPSAENCEFVVDIGETTTTQVEVFPNPTSHVLNIQSKSLIHAIDIYDTTGCIVIARTPNATVTPVNTEVLSSGVYLLVVTTEGGIIETMKLMKD